MLCTFVGKIVIIWVITQNKMQNPGRGEPCVRPDRGKTLRS
ncbi:MAG: hypothetical protein JETT_3031 [Candidatus Jettenia ecosi]|uniref:Uncharacterized protein n=1 Tax=Candidatus Jettenia ecosi TaxID=2494326 RepID=A0A533Q906_9BACT|nr:MAG: hypothetical protein JETT_3031 [Candidatus Jettenia ecosi]